MNWLKEVNSNQNDATNLTIRIVYLKTKRLLLVALHCIFNSRSLILTLVIRPLTNVSMDHPIFDIAMLWVSNHDNTDSVNISKIYFTKSVLYKNEDIKPQKLSGRDQLTMMIGWRERNVVIWGQILMKDMRDGSSMDVTCTFKRGGKWYMEPWGPGILVLSKYGKYVRTTTYSCNVRKNPVVKPVC